MRRRPVSAGCKAPHASENFFWLGLAGLLIFPSIRKRLDQSSRDDLRLRASRSGNAAVLHDASEIPGTGQGYGLTETTGICTLDDPRHVEPGRVGPAIPESK